MSFVANQLREGAVESEWEQNYKILNQTEHTL